MPQAQSENATSLSRRSVMTGAAVVAGSAALALASPRPATADDEMIVALGRELAQRSAQFRSEADLDEDIDDGVAARLDLEWRISELRASTLGALVVKLRIAADNVPVFDGEPESSEGAVLLSALADVERLAKGA